MQERVSMEEKEQIRVDIWLVRKVVEMVGVGWGSWIVGYKNLKMCHNPHEMG